jgi:integral membrane protein
MTTPKALLLLSRVEGLSLLALLLVAMPMKYALGLPLAVRVAGSAHGALFLMLLSAALGVALEKTLARGRILRVLGWSLVPFGFLLVDRDLREDSAKS